MNDQEDGHVQFPAAFNVEVCFGQTGHNDSVNTTNFYDWMTDNKYIYTYLRFKNIIKR